MDAKKGKGKDAHCTAIPKTKKSYFPRLREAQVLQYLFLLQKPILQFMKAFLLPLDRPHHLDDLPVELCLGLLQRLHLDCQLSAENLLHLLHKPKYLGQ